MSVPRAGAAGNAMLDEVRKKFIGRHLNDLPTPAAIVDRRVVASHCNKMQYACRMLGVGFRAHIKTHKTLECTQLQVGDVHTEPVNLIVSTLAEIALVLPWLKELEEKGREVNVLYSMPLPPSAIPTLNAYGESLRKAGNIAIMVDNLRHLAYLHEFTRPPSIFLKIDTGTHRAGLPVDSKEFAVLVQATLEAHQAGKCTLLGIYSHASHSYAGRDAETAMQTLLGEIQGCLAADQIVRSQPHASSLKSPFVLSVGATPTATSAKNLTEGVLAGDSNAARSLKEVLKKHRSDAQRRIELHAGVYPFLDLQQLSTQAAPSALSAPPKSDSTASTGLAIADIGMTILAEVASLYPNRSPPQALIAAGTLALGREPCPRYTGWGAISAWGMQAEDVRPSDQGWGGPGRSGWVVAKVSQEHGILVMEVESQWEGSAKEDVKYGAKGPVPFRIGQKLRVLPNHACIAGAGHPWYFVVDGNETVVDVWERCNGW